MDSNLDIKQMYRLPWTKNDNPNGWVEVTTFCQLKCPGCYRGLAEKDPKREHGNFEKIISEIDAFIESRNIQTLSIAGGEPLLYPKIKEIIEYAHSNGIKTKVFTNGILLNEEKLRELKKVGVTEFVVHIDKYQIRPDIGKLEDVNQLRQKICDTFRVVGGVNLGFIIPVSGSDYSDLSDSIKICKENSDVVNLLVISPYKDILTNKEKTFVENNLQNPNIKNLSNYISNKFKSKPCAFLGKLHNKNQPSWIFSVPVFYGDKIIGYLDSYLYKKFQERYRYKKGKYYITIKGNKIDPFSLFKLIYNKNASKILYNYLIEKNNNPSSKLTYQVVLIIDGPNRIDGKWSLCDGCPDAIYHDGNLVPSCLLERVKTGEDIFI
ncbi:hypothetical protein CL617_01030 [archaeon]|nr:hypothetical protein [archaeon]|tara:strand:- start:7399 stop:8535 length:1137 start_codon:yes stop_codon:yes gene_type:complete